MSDEGREQEIGAYYAELGLTADGDTIFYMYDMNPGLKWVICQEYEDKFNTMPEPLKSIATGMALDEDKVNRYLKGPTKEEAERDGKLVLLESPMTVFVKKKGKRADWSTAGAASEQAAGQAGQAPGTYTWEPMTGEQASLAGELAKDVAVLQWMVADEVLEAFAEQRGEDKLPTDMYADMIEHVYRGASYEFAKLWPSVRGALVTPVGDQLGGSLDPLVIAIQEAEEADFLEVLADNHPLVIDAEFAKVILRALGETGIKKEASERVIQAKKVALYLELTSRFEVPAGEAKSAVDRLLDQIEF
jgi:hypothetical protein